MKGRYFVLLPIFIFLGWYLFTLNIGYFIAYMILLYIASCLNMHYYLADIYKYRYRPIGPRGEEKHELYNLYLHDGWSNGDYSVWWDIEKVIKHTKDLSFIYSISPVFLIITPWIVVDYVIKYTNKALIWLDNNLKI
jgi:hypothetical protein